MPTGYTYAVQDGTVTTFEQFALGCARAFGALVHMRDSDADAVIPDEIVADTEYYDERIKEAEDRLVALDVMNAEEFEEELRSSHDEEVGRHKARLAEKEVHRCRYQAMLTLVQAWTPPTHDHAGIKNFMIEQLTSSIEWDCSTTHDTAPVMLDIEAALANERRCAKRDLTYNTERRDAEIKRTAERNAWLKEFRASLKKDA